MAKRPRTERREAERDAAKMAKSHERARLKLASLEPGGAPDRPIEVASASIIEPHAASMECAFCGNQGVRVEEHVAQTFPATLGQQGQPERRLRVTHVQCQRCGNRREVYFRIGTALPS